MRQTTLADGSSWPVLGLGTWRMGEQTDLRAQEIAALRRAFEIGYRLVDTAEMYGDGGAEQVVGNALHDAQVDGLRREDVIVVSKFYPQHAGRRAVAKACGDSLRRLRTDYLDLYLLHWRGATPLAETLDGLESLQRQGLIRRFGVSNFDVADLRELVSTGIGAACAVNQVYYSLSERGIEFDLLPWQREHGITLMAYCPIDQGRLAKSAALRQLASRHGMQAAALALAWTVARPGIIAIPKAVQEAHLLENWRAAQLSLDPAVLAELDRLFPPPGSPQPLAMT